MVRVFDQMSQLAGRLGRDEDAAKFAQRRNTIRTAFHSKHYRGADGGYGSQTANAMALAFEIAPPETTSMVAAALESDVREKWHGNSSVGALGQTWLYPALSDFGHTDTAYRIFLTEGPSSYSYLFNTLNGTTIWEDATKFVPGNGAEPGKSLNHPFHGGFDAWFYTGLGGINPDPANPGYKSFSLSPVFPIDLDHITVSLKTGYGQIKSAWAREGNRIRWDFTVPDNTRAMVDLPGNGFAKRAFEPGSYTLYLNKAGDELAQAQGDSRPELYNLASDPGERTNLAAQPNQTKRVASMRAEIEEWWPN